MVFSILTSLLGIVLLRIGLRGKFISPNPHCRKCRFDLQGLDLADPIPCPECGTTLRTNTPAIKIGLRKKRKLALLASFLILLTSATGLAWPKLSKLPSIQSINIYDHFPEPLLTKLATTGDDQALQSLHDRLIPGKVSGKALQTLSDHAFTLQADESTPWDERWGDVLLYTFNGDIFNDEQVDQYIRTGLQLEVVAHDEIGPHSTTLAYQIRFVESRGRSSYQFQRDLFGNNQSPWTLRIQHYETNSRPNREINRLRFQGMGPNSWIPYNNHGSIGTDVKIPAEPGETVLYFPLRLTVVSDNNENQQWDAELQHRITRLDSEPEYIKVMMDQQVVQEAIDYLTISRFWIPMRALEMSKHQSIRNVTFGLARLQLPPIDNLVLMGHLSFRFEDLEVPFREFIVELNQDRSTEIFPQNEWNEPGWLKPFIEHDKFWDQVAQAGHVDVIYRPDPALAETNPGYERMLGVPLVFRQVPIRKLMAVQEDRMGTLEWKYERSYDYQNRVDTPCEILDQ